jgi:hypothetical protein
MSGRGGRGQGAGVQEFRSSGVQEFRSSGVQEFRTMAENQSSPPESTAKWEDPRTSKRAAYSATPELL